MPTSYTIVGTGEIDASNPNSYLPAGIPLPDDTVTFGPNQRLRIPAGMIFDAKVVPASGLSDTQRSGFIIEAGGMRRLRNNETWLNWNIHLCRGVGIRAIDFNGFDLLFGSDTTASAMHNRFMCDGNGFTNLFNDAGMHGAPNYMGGPGGIYRAGHLDLKNFRVAGMTVNFGGGVHSNSHVRLYDGLFTHIGQFGTEQFSNINSDCIIVNCSFRGKTNVTVADNRMIHIRQDPNTTATGTGKKEIKKISFSAEVTLPFNPVGFTEVVLNNPLKTGPTNIGFYAQEAETGDRILVPDGAGISIGTNGAVATANSNAVRVIWFIDVSRGIARPIRLNFKSSAPFDLTSVGLNVDVRFDRLRQVSPEEIASNWISYSNLLNPTTGPKRMFVAHAGIVGDIGQFDNNTPIGFTESYVYPYLNNPHTLENSCRKIKDIVIEAVYPPNSNDAADHFIVTPAGLHDIDNSLVIDGRGGVLLNALGAAGGPKTGTYNLRHCTLITDVVANGYGLLARNETLGTFGVASTVNILSNICYVRSNTSGSADVVIINIETAGDQQIKTFDNNCYWNTGNNLAVNFKGMTSTVRGAPGTEAGYGLNDIRVNPMFVDDKRGLLPFVRQFGPYADEFAAIDYMVDGLNGYDRATDTLNPALKHNNGVDALLAFVREGYRPQNPLLLNAGHDGVTIGAFPYLALPVVSSGNGMIAVPVKAAFATAKTF